MIRGRTFGSRLKRELCKVRSESLREARGDQARLKKGKDWWVIAALGEVRRSAKRCNRRGGGGGLEHDGFS